MAEAHKEWRYFFCCTCRSIRLEAQPPAVSRRVALRRPDFPLYDNSHTATTCQPDPAYTLTVSTPKCKIPKWCNAFIHNGFQTLQYHRDGPYQFYVIGSTALTQ